MCSLGVLYSVRVSSSYVTIAVSLLRVVVITDVVTDVSVLEPGRVFSQPSLVKVQ